MHHHILQINPMVPHAKDGSRYQGQFAHRQNLTDHFCHDRYGQIYPNIMTHPCQNFSLFRTSEFIGLDLVCHAFFICTDKARVNV